MLLPEPFCAVRTTVADIDLGAMEPCAKRIKLDRARDEHPPLQGETGQAQNISKSPDPSHALSAQAQQVLQPAALHAILGQARRNIFKLQKAGQSTLELLAIAEPSSPGHEQVRADQWSWSVHSGDDALLISSMPACDL